MGANSTVLSQATVGVKGIGSAFRRPLASSLPTQFGAVFHCECATIHHVMLVDQKWLRTSEQRGSTRNSLNAKSRGSSGQVVEEAKRREHLVTSRRKSWYFLDSGTVENLWPRDLNESLRKSALEVLKRTRHNSYSF